MSWIELVRALGPVLLALGGAVTVDVLTRRRGLDPPGFGSAPGAHFEIRLLARARRGMGLVVVALTLYLGVFAPLSLLGLESEPDFSAVPYSQLFLLHAIFVAAMVLWYAFAFVGLGALGARRGDRELGGPTTAGGEPDAVPAAALPPSPSWFSQFGWRTPHWLGEIGLGLTAGLAAWFVVLVIVVALAALIAVLGAQEVLPERPPRMVSWIAALPIWLRLAVSVSAGVVEETFFRGFLQPRIGIGLSTLFFTLAHLSYEQPLMLVGIALLSLIFARLVAWRQNIWPAIAAHIMFDGLQLLVVIPFVVSKLQSL